MAANKLAKVTTRSTEPMPPMPYKLSAEEKARQRRYRAEDALRTLTRAEEIRADKALMADIKCCIDEQTAVLKRIK